MRNFSELTEREVLALAIGGEEEDARIYTDVAEGIREDYPATAQVFTEMVAEENEHRRRLLDLYQEKFGEHIPLIRRQDVRGCQVVVTSVGVKGRRTQNSLPSGSRMTTQSASVACPTSTMSVFSGKARGARAASPSPFATHRAPVCSPP